MLHRQVVERRCHLVMIGAEHLLPDCQRGDTAARPPSAGSVASSNAARLFRSRATSGWSGSCHHSSIANARRYSGSASLTRLVARSNSARLLRAVATGGLIGQTFSLIANARRYSGWPPSAGSWHQQPRQVFEYDGDTEIIGAVQPLVDRQRAAVQRLGLPQPVGVLEQPRHIVEVAGDVGDSGP